MFGYVVDKGLILIMQVLVHLMCRETELLLPLLLSHAAVYSLAFHLDLFIHFIFPLQKNTDWINVPPKCRDWVLSASNMGYVRSKGKAVFLLLFYF